MKKKIEIKIFYIELFNPELQDFLQSFVGRFVGCDLFFSSPRRCEDVVCIYVKKMRQSTFNWK